MLEMIIVIFLFAILLIGLLNIFDWQQKVYNLEQADIAATGSARNVLNAMTFSLAQGRSIISSRTVNGTGYTTGGGTVIVEVPAYDSGGNLVADTWDYIIFHVNGTEVIQIIDAAGSSARESGTKLLTDTLESLSLTYNNPTPSSASQVTVNLTNRAYYRGNQSVSVNLQETIFLRNR